MVQSRSPGYPSISLGEAIDFVAKLHAANRTNPTEREAAAKDLGYSGLTGTSAKALADLAHYGLVEKAGKGGVRVAQRAVDILYPASPEGKAKALSDAAFSPQLFANLKAHFHDGSPSENSLRAYLIRQGFANTAIPHVVKSYTDTNRLAQYEGASESHSHGPDDGPDSVPDSDAGPVGAVARVPTAVPSGVRIMENERVVFSEENSGTQYLKLVASGDLDESLLEALEDYIKRQKKRLGVTQH
jgi:hypothetical protein